MLSQHIAGVFNPLSALGSGEMVDPEEVFDLLADDYAREILAHANREPMSAKELSDAVDAHHSTIYRRIDRLQEYDLLTERLALDPDGQHYTVYSTALQGVSVTLEGDEYRVDLRTRADPADRMAKMWREIRGEER